jgi:hypothetical protein
MAIFRITQLQQQAQRMALQLPKPVELYFAVDNSNDPNDLDLCLAADATVRDEGHTHLGLDAIKRWKAETKEKYGHTIEPLQAEERDGRIAVKGRVTGNFPGSPIVLTFVFLLADGRIKELEIHG